MTVPFDGRAEDPGRLDITFVGTATVLIRHAGFTLLTDPNFLHRAERAYVGMGLSTKRLTEPAFGLAELHLLAASNFRHALAEVLEPLESREGRSRDELSRLTEMLGAGNARRVYRLKEPA